MPRLSDDQRFRSEDHEQLEKHQKGLMIPSTIIIQWIPFSYTFPFHQQNKMNKMISSKFKLLLILALICVCPSLGLSLKSHRHSLRVASHLAYKDNLQAQNWYYGNMSPLDYRLKIFKVAANDTVAACPITAPFMSADMTTCQSCSIDAPLRNLQTSKCQPCPASQTYNPSVGNCSTPTQVFQPTTTNTSTASSTTPPTNQTTIAPTVVAPTGQPATAPVVGPTATQVVNYTGPTNTTTTTTTTTTTGSAVGGNGTAVSNTTAVTPGQAATNQTSTAGTSGTGSTTTTTTASNTTTNNTGTTTPVTNTTAPAQNNTILVYNNTQVPTTTVTTTTTPTSTTTTTTTIPSTTPATNTTPVTNTTQTTQTTQATITPPPPTTNTSNTGTNSYNCPASTPLYNLTTKQCQACPSGAEYIVTTNVCLPVIYITNMGKATYLIQPSVNYTMDQSTQIRNMHPTRSLQTCPDATPYLSVLNGSYQCVGCNSKQYYSVLTQKCIDGCPIGTIYNTTLQICQPGMYLTNPDTDNLISPQDKFPQWKQSIQQQKNTTVNAQYCPHETPFQIGGKCTACADPTPYFNVQTSSCVGCGTGRSYSKDDRRCRSYYNGGLSLQRMITNIFPV